MKHVWRCMKLTVIVILVTLTGCARLSPSNSSASPTVVVDSTGSVPVGEDGEQPSGAGDQAVVSAGSCVEVFNAATIKGRSFAFDGTITSVELRNDPAMDDEQGGEAPQMPWVTFTVNHWYKGGDAQEVGVWMPMLQSGGAVSSDTSTGQISSDAGTRVLVSGEPIGVGSAPDQGIAWSCGFTRPYTPEYGQEWEAALAP